MAYMLGRSTVCMYWFTSTLPLRLVLSPRLAAKELHCTPPFQINVSVFITSPDFRVRLPFFTSVIGELVSIFTPFFCRNAVAFLIRESDRLGNILSMALITYKFTSFRGIEYLRHSSSAHCTNSPIVSIPVKPPPPTTIVRRLFFLS